MALIELKPHPQSRNDGISKVLVDPRRYAPAILAVRFRVECPPQAVIISMPAKTARGAELWKHTCFEVFLRGPGTTYWEFNFATSQHWAAYQFSDTRKGMAELSIRAPEIEAYSGSIAFEVRAAIDLADLPGLAPDAPWQLGLSAVIEGGDRTLSYWALSHPAANPDFHHRDSFAYTLPKT